MDNGIYSIEQVPLCDEVYMKKGFFGWRVVTPWKNKDGTWNLKNIIMGGDLFSVGVIVITTLAMVGFFYLQQQDMVRLINELMMRCPTINLG